jgi:signal transduction histidine kinase
VKSASRFLILLLGLTLALAALLGVEALRATRSHRVTAERALRDYATVAAWEFLSAVDDRLQRDASAALGPVAGNPAASPYDSLPSAAALSPAADSLLRCGPTDPAPRFVFALDLRTGGLTTQGDAPSAALRAWLSDTMAAAARAESPVSGRSGVVWGPAASGAVVVYAVKTVRYNGYATHEAPLAVYGVTTCRAAFAPLFAGIVARHALLPSQVTGGLPNTRLVSLAVADPEGRTIFRSGPAATAGGYAGDPASNPGSLVVRASLPSEVAGQLVVARPGARLPLLLGLLALTAGLTAVAARQLRREHELVRLRNDFTSSVSHELRTPLTQILLFGETLELGRAAGEDERRQALAIIVQEARRLTHLVENVLHLSRAERQMVRVAPAPLLLAPLLREIAERFAALAGSAAVRLRAELEDGLVATADAAALHQIVINLLDNAVKYGGPGPIVLRARLEAGRARVEVEDTGPGIPGADRNRIWEPFVRLRSGDGVPGSGIGLAVVRELVLAHGGECRVDPGASGGSRFVVELPGAERLDGAFDSADRPAPPVEAPWPAS